VIVACFIQDSYKDWKFVGVYSYRGYLHLRVRQLQELLRSLLLLAWSFLSWVL
jgi:hypothetical protein